MGFNTFSSGDTAADRRASFAETLAHLGDAAGAVEALKSALELSPDWAAGWYRLGEYHEATGEADLAIAAWRKAMSLDPSDPFGAAMKCDLLAQAGFAPPKITEAPIRQDRGEDVMGLIVFSTPAHRPAPLSDDDRNEVMA